MIGPHLFRLGQALRQLTDGRRFEAGIRSPKAAQEAKLRKILHANRDTIYGRQYGFAKIRSVAEFQSAVPICEYKTIEPYVQRIMRGETNILTSEQPLMFVQTSSTTGRPKYVPLTPGFLAEYRHAFQVYIWHLIQDYPEIGLGKMLVLASSDAVGHTENGIPYGSISGFMARRQPALTRQFYVLPPDVAVIKDLVAKYYITLLLALHQDVRYVVSVFPGSLVMLAEQMQLQAQSLIRDVREGTIRPDISLPAAVLEAVRPSLRPNPNRARELSQFAERRGSLSPMDVWPNLCVISCWKGSAMSLFMNKVRELWGDVPVRDLGYGASEGRMSIPLNNDSPSGVLALTTHFYEFVPVEEIDNEHPTCLILEQLALGREYFILLTTSGGLYRYDINDIVRVTGYYRGVPEIEFVRRGKGACSLAGERLVESQVTISLLQTLSTMGLSLKYFNAAPRWSNLPYYLMMVETDGVYSQETLRQFLSALDQALMENSFGYRFYREMGTLGSPILQVLAPGTFDRYRQERVMQGVPETQIKIPHLSPDLDSGRQFETAEVARLEIDHSVVA